MNSKGKAKLAAVLQSRMNKTNKYKMTPSNELGYITSDLSLKLDDFIPAIPKGEYSVCDINIQVGDRVLIAWANSEPIIINKIITNTKE